MRWWWWLSIQYDLSIEKNNKPLNVIRHQQLARGGKKERAISEMGLYCRYYSCWMALEWWSWEKSQWIISSLGCLPQDLLLGWCCRLKAVHHLQPMQIIELNGSRIERGQQRLSILQSIQPCRSMKHDVQYVYHSATFFVHQLLSMHKLLMHSDA